MRVSNRIWMITILLIPGFLGSLMTSCDQESYEERIVMVQAASDNEADGYRLVVLDPVRTELDILLPAGEFNRFGSVEVSFDGERLLFEARRDIQDPWQIWELNLKNSELRQVTDVGTDCRNPAYLPGGRIVYSRYVNDSEDSDARSYHMLETSDLSGKERRQITFDPVDYRSSHVLKDGRILCLAREVYPELKEAQLVVMRPDGTKKELFHEVQGGSMDMSLDVPKAYETEGGLVVFAERSGGSGGLDKLMSVRYDRPLASRAELIGGQEGTFQSVGPGLNGELLVSFSQKSEGNYGLYSLKPDAGSELSPIFSDPEYNILWATGITPRKRPKNLPSEVDLDANSALLMCQDADFVGTGGHDKGRRAAKVELLGLEGSLGTADLQEDGSVYLKVSADTPFRMQTLDSSGMVVKGPSSWINLRPNERRGCVGCHAGHELTPFNRQPLAVQKEPVEIPKYSEAIMADARSKHLKQ